jgi:hypothetical protein
MIPGIASKGVDVMQNLATQRVIGYSISKTKYKKKSVVQENLNIGVQAWEIGALLGGVALYEYVNGPGSLLNNLFPSSSAPVSQSTSSKSTFCQMFPTSVLCL